MPWTLTNPPSPAKNWPTGQKKACVSAANSALKRGKSDKEAIMACIGAGKRVKENKMTENPRDHTIEDVEIFSTGVWNGETYDLDDLKELVKNFGILKGSIDPPLKFGHDPDQTLTREGEENLVGQFDGDMALGWIDSLRIKGNKLLATFVGVPEIVYQAMKRRRYSKISAEIFSEITHKGKEIGKALKAVALLGADLPAVTDLEDLAVFLTENKIPSSLLTIGGKSINLYSTDGTGTPFILIHKEDSQMAEQEEAKNFSAKDQRELEDLRTFKVEKEAEIKTYKDRSRIAEFTSKRDSILKTLDIEVTKGHVTPAVRDEFDKFIMEQIETYKEGGTLSVPADKVAEMISKYSEKLPTKEEAKDREEEEDASSDNPSQDFVNAVKAIQGKNPDLSYIDASKLAQGLHPDLFKLYTDHIESTRRAS